MRPVSPVSDAPGASLHAHRSLGRIACARHLKSGEPVEVWTAHVDGAARGNPGPAGIGIIIVDGAGNVVKEIGEPLGRTTNNVAEYTAMVRALEEARSLGCSRLAVYTDSELMAHQLNGRYAVKAAHLLPLYQRACLLLKQFEAATVTHV